MNWSNLTLGRRITISSGVLIILLSVVAVWSYSGVGTVVHKAENVIQGNQLQSLLAHREIDHLNWVTSVCKVLTREDLAVHSVGVQTDDHKCGLGTWLYGEERKEIERRYPTLAPLLKELEDPHRHLHETAVDIDKHLASDAPDRYKASSEILTQRTMPALATVQGIMKRLSEEGEAHVETDEEMLAAAASTRRAVMLLGVIAVIVGVVLSVLTIRSINRALIRIVSAAGEGANQIASAATQVSSAAQGVAEGSQEQAASIEETSSSVEELSAMTKQNADNAKTVAQLMNEATQLVGKASSGAERMDRAMSDIKSASDQTSKIIKTIDEIAFQTNLLALNAAVEAARAGEAGKGFAVVAEEVRNLAMRAAEAAKNTGSLIEENVNRVAGGVQIVDGLRSALSDVQTSAGKVANLVNEVAAASDEQSRGLDQINTAVSQMNQVTQQNAANAEEAASASEEAAGQSESLRELVGELTRLVGGSLNDANHGAHHVYGAPQRPSSVRATSTMYSPTSMAKPKMAPKLSKPAAQTIPLDDDEATVGKF
ncbi:CZB domain-containing protein [bacterium]|nr:CZB domain-containing protein [bacterium]MBU1984494.1 CZB domain-containing protein [bacterium]